MQVALAVPSENPWLSKLGESGLSQVNRAFWVFSITVIFGSAVIWALILGIPLAVLIWQAQWAYRMERRRRAGVSGNWLIKESPSA